MPQRLRRLSRPLQAALQGSGSLHRDVPGAEAPVLRQLRRWTRAADHLLVHVRCRVAPSRRDLPGIVELGGLRWGWLDDPPPAMHLATPDRKHLVWLEDAGDVLFVPASPAPSVQALDALRAWTARHRHRVERRWIAEVMVPHGWLDASVANGRGDVIVEAYCGTPNWFGVVVPREQVAIPSDVLIQAGIDATTGDLVIRCSGLAEDRRDLATLLW